jgi:hypothetical protein
VQLLSNFLNNAFGLIITFSAVDEPDYGVKLAISIHTTVADDIAKLIFFSPACTRGTSAGGRMDLSIWSLCARSTDMSVLDLTFAVTSRNT